MCGAARNSFILMAPARNVKHFARRAGLKTVNNIILILEENHYVHYNGYQGDR